MREAKKHKITWKVGRKATGLKRDKALILRYTDEELQFANEIKETGGSKADSILKMLNYKGNGIK